MIWIFKRKEWIKDLNDNGNWYEVTFKELINTITRSSYGYAISVIEI